MPQRAGMSGDYISLLIGENDVPIRAPRSVLNNSPILRDWIENPDQIPQTLIKNDCLYLRACDPETVQAVLYFLGNPRNTRNGRWGECPLTGRETAMVLLRMYKFAKSIKADAACVEAMNRLYKRNIDVEEFVQATIVAGQLAIVEDKKVVCWIASWLSRNMERMGDSIPAQVWLRSGSLDTWTFAMTLMASLGRLHESLEDVESQWGGKRST